MWLLIWDNRGFAKRATAGYIAKNADCHLTGGESGQCNWQLQQVALTTFPRHSKFVPVKGMDEIVRRIVFTSTNESSLIYTVIFFAVLQLNVLNLIRIPGYRHELNPFLFPAEIFIWHRLQLYGQRIT